MVLGARVRACVPQHYSAAGAELPRHFGHVQNQAPDRRGPELQGLCAQRAWESGQVGGRAGVGVYEHTVLGPRHNAVGIGGDGGGDGELGREIQSRDARDDPKEGVEEGGARRRQEAFLKLKGKRTTPASRGHIR